MVSRACGAVINSQGIMHITVVREQAGIAAIRSSEKYRHWAGRIENFPANADVGREPEVW